MSFSQPRKKTIVAVALLVGLVVNFTLGWRMLQAPMITFGDGIDYLDAAYHLRRDLVFTTSADDGTAPPGIGREPGYPVFLALLMSVDAGLASYRPACAAAATHCDAARFRALSVANLLLVEIAAVLVFCLATAVTGRAAGGLVAAAYILLNINLLRFHWYDPMSDSLSLALVAAAMLALERAARRGGCFRGSVAGLTLAALTLTKAIFLPFCLVVAGAAACRSLSRPLSEPAGRRWLLVAAAVYVAIVGGWVARNWQVSGMARLTDERGGIALSTREVFDHMTLAQIAAAFVYWTPGGGEGLAQRIFARDTVAPFMLYAPGGFYDRGQNGYGRRVDAVMRSQGVDAWQARAAVDTAIVGEILGAPLGYALSTPPLLYRGLWIDQFAIISVPLLVWTLWRALRSGRLPIVLLLGFGVFNELFYALFSLNIPRYQITAIPALALAAAIVARAAMRRLRSARA